MIQYMMQRVTPMGRAVTLVHPHRHDLVEFEDRFGTTRRYRRREDRALWREVERRLSTEHRNSCGAARVCAGRGPIIGGV